MKQHEVEAKAKDAFYSDLMKWLMDQPYYTRTLGKDKKERKRVAQEIAKRLTTIPHAEGSPFNREVRRRYGDQLYIP